MPKVYGRDLDLNLLRVFAVVAESGSVTEAASRLYLTQPAVSASLRRLKTAVGAPLFVRSGRGLALSSRGERLRAGIQPHLQKLLEATLEPPTFDPRTSTRTIRIGLSDSAEAWFLPKLLRVLEAEAPGLRIIVVPVQFRTVAEALASVVDMASGPRPLTMTTPAASYATRSWSSLPIPVSPGRDRRHESLRDARQGPEHDATPRALGAGASNA